MGISPADEVVQWVVGVRIRADRHANPAIGADLVPVGEAGFWVDAPAQHTIFFLPRFKGDRSAGAVLGTFLAYHAEIDHGWIWLRRVCDHWQVSSDHSQPDSGSKFGSHQHSNSSNLSQTGIPGDWWADDAVVAVHMGARSIP